MRHRRSLQESSTHALHHVGIQRRPRSVTSNNSSSISTKSPPWTLTRRPQEQSTTWPEDDQLTVDGDPSVMSAISSWQEEAHWMSFRNALHCFVTIHENQTDDASSANYSASTTSRTIVPSVNASVLEAHENDLHAPECQFRRPSIPSLGDNYRDEILADHDDLVAAGVSLFGNSSTAADTSARPSGNQGTTNSPSPHSSKLASELAETKMRLALAQAERDELEFALITGSSESRSHSAT